MSKKHTGAVILGAIVLVSGIGLSLCIEKIPAGYAGIVYSMSGGVQEDVLGQGWKVVSPTKKVIAYPVSIETMYLSKDAQESSKNDDSFNISTKDGKMVNVDAELSYRYDPDKLSHVFTKWRGKSSSSIEDTYIRARIKEAANEITSTYSVLDVYGEKRSELNKKVTDMLRSKLEEDGIILETFNFTRIEPDAQTQTAIQLKVDAQQKTEQAKVEAERQAVENQKIIEMKEAEATQQIIAAEAAAAATKIKAQGDADARIMQAEAEAKANTMINESLTAKVLELKRYQKWDGSVPQIQGAGVTPIVDVRSSN